jgi:uncharacterized protein
MKKIWLAAAGVVVLLASLVMVGCTTDNATPVNVSLNSQQQGLWVNGEGKISVTPDLAIINLGIQAQETAVADAQAKASEAMDKVIKALKAQGIDDKDIQTQYFNISQISNWDMNKEVVTGYRVTNTVTVKVRDITKPGQVIDAVVAAGGDMTRVNGITFTLEKPAAKYVEARALAMDHAAAKAKEIADKTGVKLGKVTYVTESSNNYGPVMRNYAMSDSAMAVPVTVAAPVSIGELEITATVQIAYAIN